MAYNIVAAYVWVKTVSGDRFLPDGTKPSPKPVLNY